MKKLFSLLTLLMLASGLWAQPTANDFWIHGTVTNSTTNVGIPNHKMIIYEPAENNLPMLLDSTFTDANGYYSYVVTNGSTIGPNRNYYVQTFDCQSSASTQHLMNNQGTTDVGIANFSICDNSTACQAEFTTQQQNNNPLGIYFLSSSTAGVGTITGWSWSFGDGTGANNEPNISTFHTYANPGSYVACLTITTSEGCTSTFCDSIYIASPCAGLAGYTVNTSPTSLTATFIGTFDGVVNNQATYGWNYGDNTTGVGGPTNTHTYAAAGTYNACVTVTYNGCSDTYCQQITVGQQSCTSSLTVTPANDPGLFHFNVTTTGSTAPYTYVFNFGDGGNQTFTSMPVSHTFTSPGTYNVCVYVTGADGCTSSSCQSVTVTFNNNCQANFTITPQNNNPLGIYFLNASTVPTGTITSWTWTFGDGTSQSSPQNNISTFHSYANDGYYTACLTITTSEGCTSTFCDSIVVGTPSLCNGSFTFTANNLLNSYQFMPGTVNNGYSHLWTFGDGTSSTNVDPNHVYTNPGVYTVCHTIFNNNGCQDTECQNITIGNSGCTSSIIINQDPNAPYTYEFSASVTGGTAPYTYTFNFGDGPNETTTTLPLVHTYTTMGNYSVCLYVSDANGCISSSCDSLSVSPSTNCQAYFYGNPLNPNNSADLAIQFTDYSVSGDSLNPIIGWTWNFGDGETSALQNPMHDYVVAGVYYVCLTVWNNNGCQSTYCDSINVGSGNPSNNIISGTVYTSNSSVANNAYVFLLRFDYPNSQLVPQDADVTQNGAYLFSAVPNGDYVVKAALTPNDPLYAVRIPTYYTSAFLWNFGDVITINNNSYTGADIHMIEGSNPGGPGFIGGSVDWADTLRAATDFSGATVVLQTIDGNNIGFAIADANGDYSFPNLAYGTYKLYADFPGYTGNPTFVTITPITDSITGTQVLLGPATITGVEETSAIDNISLYPNPTTDNATLVVEATKTAQLNLTVVNMMGQVVGSQTINAFAGKNIVQLNTDGLAQGVYSLVLRDSKGVAKVQRLIKQQVCFM